ncbi:MAG TPA: HesA/MoeB/ThiF family protein [Phycisphaerae bacterium]|nr:HesA/MoeB/ThiF family protein [Phycisphaerae bacterium]
MSNAFSGAERYSRQVLFDGLGPAGQHALMSGRALIVGLGGMGSWTAELLARAGVGFLRLADADCVAVTNLHRQTLYDEQDVLGSRPKAEAAADHLKRINSAVEIDAVSRRLDRLNIAALAGDVGLILDGTDNFATRYLINDYAVKSGRPWVFAGVVGTEAQTMTIVPGRTPCLRCVLDSPPPACADPSCRSAGVLGPAVAAVAALQAAEAMKILSGRIDEISPYLLKFDIWENRIQRIDVRAACGSVDCPCCKHRDFEFLEP